MMTAYYTTAEGDTITVYHHSDWSGIAEVFISRRGAVAERYVIPGDILLLLGKEAALDLLRNKVQSHLETYLATLSYEDDE